MIDGLKNKRFIVAFLWARFYGKLINKVKVYSSLFESFDVGARDEQTLTTNNENFIGFTSDFSERKKKETW